MSSQNKKKRYDNVNNDLETLISSYDALSISKIERVIPVYFPIAIVEMDTLERSFEDFDSIELIILRLIEAGIKTPKAISGLLGLDEKFITKMLMLLNGYGHIFNGEITDLGRESLQKEKKIELKAGTQHFQINALNNTVIRLEELVSSKQIDDKENSRIRVAHLMGVNRIEIQQLKEQLTKGDYTEFIQSGKEQSVNLEKITDIRFVEMKYAYCYMVKLFNCQPMIFCKRFNQAKSEIKERFKWVPMSVPNTTFYYLLNIKPVIPITSNAEIEKMNQVIQLLNEERNRTDPHRLKENYNFALEWTYPFNFHYCRPELFKNGLIMNVDENAFPEYTISLYHILKYFGQFGKYIIVRDNFCGNVLRIEPNSDYLKKVSKKLMKKIDEYGEKRIKRAIENYFESNSKKEKAIQSIDLVLDHIK